MKKKLSQMTDSEIFALSSEEMEKLVAEDPEDFQKWKAKVDADFDASIEGMAHYATPYMTDTGKPIAVVGGIPEEWLADNKTKKE